MVLDAATDPPTLLAEVSECIGVTTNNVAEYTALIAGLEAAAHLRRRASCTCAPTRSSSIEQVKGAWKVKQPNLRPLHAEARALLAAYDDVDLQHVPREENTDADALVNAALDAASSEARAMLLWFVFGSIFGVWNVFQSPGLDFRLIAVGALLPALLDLPFGAQAYAHTLLVGRRRARARRWRVTAGPRAPAAAPPRAQPRDRLVHRARARAAAWAHKEVFWWPAFGDDAPARAAAPAVAGAARRGAARARGGVVDVDAASVSRDAARRRRASGAPAGSTIAIGEERVIAFVRHGQTELNRDGRLQGRIDVELSERGPRAGRARSARGSRGADDRRGRVSSPLQRAQQTAAAIAAVARPRRSRSTTG